MLEESLKILMCCRVVRATLCGDAKLYVILVLHIKLYNLAKSMLNYHIDTGLYNDISIIYFNLYLF